MKDGTGGEGATVANDVEMECTWQEDKKPNIIDEDEELDRREVVRLIIQYLEKMGCNESARAIERESGMMALSVNVKQLRRCVLEGKWDELEKVLEDLGEFRSEKDARSARFVLYKQQFLELLEKGSMPEALESLRTKLAPVCEAPEMLKELAMFLICRSPEELKRRANWTGKESRTAVLETLQSYIPPNILLPENRLEVLLKQALKYQKMASNYPYTKQSKATLLEDLEYSPEKIPTTTIRVLRKHTDEVWFVQFSHNGRWLVSASKDKTVIVWEVAALLVGDSRRAVKHVFEGQEDDVSFLSFSPDDKLLSCGNNSVLRLWNIETGECVETLRKHGDKITAGSWLSNSTFVTAGHDKQILVWENVNGKWENTHTIDEREKIFDMGFSGTKIVTICSENIIHMYNPTTWQEVQTIKEDKSVMSLCVAPDGSAALVNMSTAKIAPVIHEWDLRMSRLVQEYRGQRQTKFVIRSCFGGQNQHFVVSGSEDNKVYLWRRKTGELLGAFSGHTGTVNSVSWNPADAFMFASASDDGTVRIWGAPWWHNVFSENEEKETNGRTAPATGNNTANGSSRHGEDGEENNAAGSDVTAM